MNESSILIKIYEAMVGNLFYDLAKMIFLYLISKLLISFCRFLKPCVSKVFKKNTFQHMPT